jgi:hypothetical protein
MPLNIGPIELILVSLAAGGLVLAAVDWLADRSQRTP